MSHVSALPEGNLPLSALDLQILLVLSEQDLYGYAIKKAVEAASGGVITPEIGFLYRVLNRLMESGWVEKSPQGDGSGKPHRGRPRRYFRITGAGTDVARAELRRLRQVLEGASELAPEAS